MLRSPHAHARVRKLDLTAALAAPGVRDAIGPDECHVLVREAGFQGAPVAAVAADSYAEAARALELVEVEWEELGPFLDTDDAIAEGKPSRSRAATAR